MEKIIIILLMHTVGDHVFQWAGLSLKKRSNFAYLSLHAGIYGVILAIFAFFLLGFSTTQITLLYILINLGLHLVIDFLTGVVKQKYWDQKNESIYFTIISLDQIIHLACLILTYMYFTNQIAL